MLLQYLELQPFTRAIILRPALFLEARRARSSGSVTDEDGPIGKQHGAVIGAPKHESASTVAAVSEQQQCSPQTGGEQAGGPAATTPQDTKPGHLDPDQPDNPKKAPAPEDPVTYPDSEPGHLDPDQPDDPKKAPEDPPDLDDGSGYFGPDQPDDPEGWGVGLSVDEFIPDPGSRLEFLLWDGPPDVMAEGEEALHRQQLLKKLWTPLPRPTGPGNWDGSDPSSPVGVGVSKFNTELYVCGPLTESEQAFKEQQLRDLRGRILWKQFHGHYYYGEPWMMDLPDSTDERVHFYLYLYTDLFEVTLAVRDGDCAMIHLGSFDERPDMQTLSGRWKAFRLWLTCFWFDLELVYKKEYKNRRGEYVFVTDELLRYFKFLEYWRDDFENYKRDPELIQRMYFYVGFGYVLWKILVEWEPVPWQFGWTIMWVVRTMGFQVMYALKLNQNEPWEDEVNINIFYTYVYDHLIFIVPTLALLLLAYGHRRIFKAWWRGEYMFTREELAKRKWPPSLWELLHIGDFLRWALVPTARILGWALGALVAFPVGMGIGYLIHRFGGDDSPWDPGGGDFSG